VSLVQCLEYRRKDRAVFAARSSDGNVLARVEEFIRGNGVVDFVFEDTEEAGFAKFLVIFGPEDEGAVCVAY